jgi:hypothetical protein
MCPDRDLHQLASSGKQGLLPCEHCNDVRMSRCTVWGLALLGTPAEDAQSST